MMTIDNRNVGAVNLPPDLRTVVDERTLLRIILESIPEGDSARTAGSEGSFRPTMMLTLVSYAYAIGVYGSADLESALLRDPTLRYICARQFPGWQDIRRFRRGNRARIELTLSAVLMRVFLEHLFPSSPEAAAQLSMMKLCEQIQAEANHRIETAILLDGVEVDV